MQGEYSETAGFSEEQGETICFNDKPVVSSIYCYGSYCDNKKLRCKQPSNFVLGSERYHSHYFSEEHGAMAQCPVTKTTTTT